MSRVCFFWMLVAICLLLGCSTDDVQQNGSPLTLAMALEGRQMVAGNVIACAASEEGSTIVSVFLYPRPNVENIRYFETVSTDVERDDLKAYREVVLPLMDVFNGYLLKYEIVPEEEKWVIVTFEEDGIVHISNPIRLKQKTQPTEYLPQNVSIDSASNMPVFSWMDGALDDSVIYFQVVSNENNLLSGTYTQEPRFQYYNLDNVVLNITREEPPELKTDEGYRFSLLAVSDDNWVNLFAEVDFELE